VAFLLDTTILIAAIKGHPAVAERLRSLEASQQLLSSVVLGELETGVLKSAWPERNREQLERVVNQLELISVDGAVAKAYGRIRAGIAQQGTPIGANDLWIAAQALVCGAVLVTANLREFERVEGLSLDNWLA